MEQEQRRKRRANGTSSPTEEPTFQYSSPFVEKAMAYARGVVSGEIVACLYVRQACQRHLDDLRDSDNPAYPYRFDERKASRICWFISQMPHVSGRWAKRVRGVIPRIVLEPWQCFIWGCIFGWVDKTSGLRRFRKVYIEVPRKNTKSTMVAAVGNYMFTGDGEEGAQVFSGATKRKQAMEVFRPARLMALRSPKFLEKFDIEVNISSMTRPDDSRFEPLVKNPGDGSSPSLAIVDEYHEHQTSTLHDAMETGMGSREQGLIVVITTAGSNTGGPCYMLRDDVIKVLSGSVADDERFGIIYTLDEGDDWRTEIALRKCNPNYGVSVYEKFLKGQQQTAEKFAHKRNIILTKHFNLWQNAASAWMDPEKWKACGDKDLKIERFKGWACWHGSDLGGKLDLLSRCLIFKEARMVNEEEEIHYYVFGYHYAPKNTIEDGDHSAYVQWKHDGFLIEGGIAEVIYSRVLRDIQRDAEIFDMKALAFDPWNATYIQQELEAKYGDDVVLTVPQTTQMFSDPMKELQAAVYAGRLHHNGDPVLAWAMSNVVVREGNNESVFPRKGPNEKLKIDPVSALLTGFNRAYTAPITSKYTSTEVWAI